MVLPVVVGVKMLNMVGVVAVAGFSGGVWSFIGGGIVCAAGQGVGACWCGSVGGAGGGLGFTGIGVGNWMVVGGR